MKRDLAGNLGNLQLAGLKPAIKGIPAGVGSLKPASGVGWKPFKEWALWLEFLG